MDQNLLAVPHGFTQRATSFVASWCQGIHRMPFCRSINASFKEAHSTTAKLERDFAAYPPCTGTINRRPYRHRCRFECRTPLGTRRKTQNTYERPQRHLRAGKSCNVHGHHNRNFCIIIHLNTSKSQQLYFTARADP